MWVGPGWLFLVVTFLVATFNLVGKSLNLFVATTGDVWIILFFSICGYVLHVEHIPCVITNFNQQERVITSLSITLYVLLEKTLPEITVPIFRLILKNLLYQVAFLYSFLSLYFLLTFFRLVCFLSMWFCVSQGINSYSLKAIVNWYKVVVSNDKST